MNTLKTMKTRMLSRTGSAIALLVAATMMLGTAGCGGVRGRWRGGPPAESGFLRDYSQLAHVDGYPAALVYINPSANWSSYDAVFIDSVTLWHDGKTAKVSEKDQQMLTDYFYKALADKIGERYRVAKGPGQGVLRLRAALTAAKGANVPLKAITTIIPQLRAATTLVGLGADIAVTVGEAIVEAEITDSISGVRLTAVVDERVGKKAVYQLKKWSDVKAACEYWAERAVSFLARQGVRPKA